MSDIGYRLVRTQDLELEEVVVVERFWDWHDARDGFEQALKERSDAVTSNGTDNYISYEGDGYMACLRNAKTGVIEEIIALEEFETA